MSPEHDPVNWCAQESTALRRHLQGSLDSLWRGYCKKLRRCQKRFSEKSVHNLRVATRRMLSQLDMVGALHADDSYRKARRILKKRLDVFDDLRDVQVQLQYVGRMQRLYPELSVLLEKLERRERRLIKSVAKKVRGFRTGKVTNHLARLEKTLRSTFKDPRGAERNAASLERAVQQAFDKVVALRGRIDPSNTATIHRTRIAFKKFRYMVESLQPLLPKASSRQLERMHRYQTRMGEIQDIEILMARLDVLVGKKKFPAPLLHPFRRKLSSQRARQIKAYSRSADQLFTFWPCRADSQVPTPASPSPPLSPEHQGMP